MPAWLAECLAAAQPASCQWRQLPSSVSMHTPSMCQCPCQRPAPLLTTTTRPPACLPAPRLPRLPRLQRAIASIRDVFRKFDADNSGTIDRAELKECLKALGAELPDEEIQEMFKVREWWSSVIMIVVVVVIMGRWLSSPRPSSP